MALQVSTKFKELLLGGMSFADIFRNGIIRVYTGAQPASADAATTGTLLGNITSDVNSALWVAGSPTAGLRFTMAGQFVIKDPFQTWTIDGVANGTAGWFRLYANSPDAGGVSYSYARLDGAIGVTGQQVEMRLSSLGITNGTSTELQQFIFTIPPVNGA